LETVELTALKHIEDIQAVPNVRTTLDHELLDDAVESRALISVALLSSGQSAEVLSGLGNGLAVEADGDAAELLIAVGDVEVDLSHQLASKSQRTPDSSNIPCA
jgi:hypothetical protein